MKRVVHKHPLAIRWFHWINFPVLALMIWSGLLIYWAYKPYKISVGSVVLVKFFPDWFFKALNVPFRLAEGMSLHFAFMWLFTINGLLYALYLFASGEWRLIFPEKKSFRESWYVVLHDLGLRKTAPPQRKYNGAQRIAYTAVLFMGLGATLTGLAIYKPTQTAWLTGLFGGYQTARLIHFALTIGFVLFFLVHIAQVVRAGWRNFQSMITGVETLDAPHESLQTPASARGTDH